jgi:ATP-dependent DNA ligase
MGYLAASPSRISSLILAQYDQRGKIAYAGLAGTGLSEETRGMLLVQLHALKRKTCPCVPVPVLRHHFGELRTDLPPQWVKPVLVVQVEYRQRTGRIAPRCAQGAAPRSVTTAGGQVDAPMTADSPDRFFPATLLGDFLHVRGHPRLGSME